MDVTQLQAAQTMLSSVGELSEGIGEKRAADFEAKQLRQQAKATRSEAAQQAQQEARQGRLVESAARAAMGGSGVSLTGAQSLEQLQGIQGASEFNQLAALFQGDLRASALEGQATARKREGRSALIASGTKSIGTVLKSASTVFDEKPPKKAGKAKQNPYDNSTDMWDY